MTLDAAASRRAAWILLALALVALLLRAAGFASLGLDHFDEGVYALSALGIADPAEPLRLYPGELRFSPPVYFSLAGAVARALGIAVEDALIGVNVALGSSCVLAVGWIGRRWFGAAAGLAAAALLATSEYHVALSRTGLTDVAFALFFLLALFALVEAFQRKSVALALLAGLAVGLAWNTKYHGWLALAIAGLALVPTLLASWRAGTRDAWRLLGLWFLAALAAAACYVPWALYVEAQPGGYRGLMEYQSTMLRTAWLDNAVRQVLQQLWFEGPASRAGVLAALGVAVLALRARVGALTLLLVAFAAAALGGSGAAFVFALCALPRLLAAQRTLGGTAVAVWILVWLVLTPVYQPYARLVLPLSLAVCLAAGSWLAREGERSLAPASKPAGALALLATLVAFAAAAWLLPDPSDPWKRVRGLDAAAKAMEQHVPAGGRVIVLGEPSLAYHLQVAGREAFERVDGSELGAVLDAAREPLFVVAGLYAGRTGALRELTERFGERLVLVDTQPFEPRDVRLLDDFQPRRAFAFHRRPTREYDLELYRFEPAR